MRSLMFSSSEATSPRAPSVVAMTLLARCELSIACVMPEISLRKPSEAISPAGSSAPRLMRRPLERRCSVSLRFFCVLPSPRWAVSDATFVLMRAMSILHDCVWQFGPLTQARLVGTPIQRGSARSLLFLVVPRVDLVLGRAEFAQAGEVFGFHLRRGAVLASDGVVDFLAVD